MPKLHPQPSAPDDAAPEGVAPCKGCPFLRCNHSRRTDGGFYTIKNLRRLWSGVRSGETMICHATDPNAHETGSPARPKPGQIKEGNERVCLGALYLYRREEQLLVNECGGDYKTYVAHPDSAAPPMKVQGFLAVVEAVMFAGTPLGPKIDFLQPDMTADVALPWESQGAQP